MDIGGFTRVSQPFPSLNRDSSRLIRLLVLQDYEILSELMDHDHHTVHNDTTFERSQCVKLFYVLEIADPDHENSQRTGGTKRMADQ